MSIVTIRDALNQALHAEMARDETVVCIGEDISGGVFGVTRGLTERFGPQRVIDTPISETAFVGMAIGAAMTGMRPVVEIMFCDFMGVCFDQLLNQAAKIRFLSGGRLDLPLTVRMTMGAGDGSGAMHSASLHGMLASIPGLTVVCPATPADAGGLLRSAIRSNGPVVVLEHKGLYDLSGPPPTDAITPMGFGHIVEAGDDVTIVALAGNIENARQAAKAKGISAEVIDPRTISPLDTDLILKSVRKTGRLLVVDEGPAFSGFADAVVSLVVREAFSALVAAPVSVCPPMSPVPYAENAEAAWLPNQTKIEAALGQLMNQA